MKIILNEEQTEILKLPPFIYKPILDKSTSLGDNPAIPPYGDFGMEYAIVKKKFNEVSEIIDKYIEIGELESKDENYLLSVLSTKIKECKEIEKTLAPQLEKLCENIVNNLFSVPTETILLSCKLVGKVKPKNSIRILPEDGDSNEYNFEDVDEVELTNKVILKRRFVNSLIQGLSYWLSTEIDDWYDTVSTLNGNLWRLWFNIIHITDYLLFTRNEKISNKNPKMMSYVEVKLGKNGKKTIINAQGIVFPYLLRDTIRGFLELFSVHSLPDDTAKAMYVLRKADFLVAEPWDLRLGMGLVDMLHSTLTKDFKTSLLSSTNRIPYFFRKLTSLDTDTFNDVMRNFLIGTKKGNRLAHELDSSIEHNVEYQKFKDRVNQKNIKTSLISDDCISKDELDDIVIEEDMDEITAYHGSGADFEKFNHKKYLNSGVGSQSFGWGTYVSDDIYIANGYVENALEDSKYDMEDAIYKALINFGMPENVAVYKYNSAYEELKSFLRNSSEKHTINYLNDIIANPKLYNSDEESLIRVKAMLYVLENRPKKDAYLYEVEIPDDNGFNYLSWYDTLTDEQIKAVSSKIYEFERRYDGLDFGELYFGVFDRKKTGDALYTSLRYVFYNNADVSNNSKAASLFLMQCGFDGIKYPAGTRWQKPDGSSEDAMNYVIFDANKVKIVNKTER